MFYYHHCEQHDYDWEFPLNESDILNWGVLYIFCYGLGVLVLKFYGWLRLLILFVVIAAGIVDLKFYGINKQIFLEVIIPRGVFVLPSFVRFFASLGLSNPFSWIFRKLAEMRYKKKRDLGIERERENLERAERIFKMQAEEAERQRQFERERAKREEAEREAQREQYQKHQQSDSHNSDKNQGRQRAKQEQKHKAKQKEGAQDPYAVLEVTRDMSKAEIHKAYLRLVSQYAPDRVAHHGKDLQKMAHEKCIAFNLAWEKIRKGDL